MSATIQKRSLANFAPPRLPRRLFPLELVALLLLAAFLGGCQAELFANLSEREANEILATLEENGISAKKQSAKDVVTISVAEKQFAAAIRLLEKAGLPRENFDTFPKVMGEDGLLTSPSKEHARLVYIRAQELSSTISEIDGVLSARVHLSVPKKENPFDEIAPPSASVFIRHLPSASVETIIPQIKRLVANAVAGLSYDNIALVLLPEEDSTRHRSMRRRMKPTGSSVSDSPRHSPLPSVAACSA